MRILMIAMLVAMSMATGEACADAKAGEKKAQLCLLCHKPGNITAAAPLLEAQPVKYLVAATTAYKTGKRPDPAMKANTAALSVRDIADISDYFASRPPLTGVYSVDPVKANAGELRVKELNCASCHGPSFAGSDLVPRLAGQTTGYLVNQLQAFAKNGREHPPIETPFAKMGDVETMALYFTSLK